MERWGAPIHQPMPSVRYVPTGTVFNALEPLPLPARWSTVDAGMNYRKRGLVYFSGFDFRFTGDYDTENPFDRDVDVAFVFPISLEKNKVLLSELSFTVNGAAAPVELGKDGDKLLWTGRLRPGEKLAFRVAFKGRGLDAFTYTLDPAAPVAEREPHHQHPRRRQLRLRRRRRPGDRVERTGDVIAARLALRLARVGDPDRRHPAVGEVLRRDHRHLRRRGAGRGFLLFFAGLVALCAPPRAAAAVLRELPLRRGVRPLLRARRLPRGLPALLRRLGAGARRSAAASSAATRRCSCRAAPGGRSRGWWRAAWPCRRWRSSCRATPASSTRSRRSALLAALMAASARPEGLHVLASLGLVDEPKGADHVA